MSESCTVPLATVAPIIIIKLSLNRNYRLKLIAKNVSNAKKLITLR